MTQVFLQRAKLLFNTGRAQEAKEQVMALLRKDPQNEKLWIHLHLYTEKSDPEVSRQALFKAYDINPSSALVLNCMMRYYHDRGEFSKLFRVLQLANKLNHENPHVLSLLFVLNALLAVSQEVDLTARREHHMEALGLAQRTTSLKDIKEDPHMLELAQSHRRSLHEMLVTLMAL